MMRRASLTFSGLIFSSLVILRLLLLLLGRGKCQDCRLHEVEQWEGVDDSLGPTRLGVIPVVVVAASAGGRQC